MAQLFSLKASLSSQSTKDRVFRRFMLPAGATEMRTEKREIFDRAEHTVCKYMR